MRWLEVTSGASLTLLMFSGDVKPSPLLGWLPVDLTGAALVLVTVMVVLTMLWTEPVVVPLGGLLILAALVPGFLVGTSNPYTAHDRVSVLISIYTAACAFVLLRTPGRRQAWLWSMTAAGILVVPLLATGSEGTLSVGGRGATISAAQLLGLAILVLLVLGMCGRIRGHASIVLTTLVVLVLGYLMVATGSRGPTLALVVALGVAVLVVRRDLVKRAALGAVALVLLWVVLLVAGSAGAERMRLAASGGLGSSPRVTLWREAIAAIPTTPSGCGWGNFWSVLTPAARLDSGYAQHAHNTVLEAFVEGGWVAGVAITVFIVLALRRQLSSAYGDPYEAAALAVAVFLVACSMVSGTVGDDRAMFAVLAAAFAVAVHPRKETVPLLSSGVELSLPPRWVRPAS